MPTQDSIYYEVLGERNKLIEALKILYEADMDYIKINNLGGENNQRFIVARELLAKYKNEVLR